MAVPNSGNELSLLGIRREVGANNYNSSNTYTDISLEDLSEGTVDALNTANDSSDMPDGSEPHAMSEWYSYDHDLTGIATPTNLNVSATQTATIAGLQFDVNDSTDRIYAFLRNDGKMLEECSLTNITDHIEHLMKFLGEDNIAIGSDFDGAVVPKEIKNLAGMINLENHLNKLGYHKELVEKIFYKNWLNFLKLNLI